MSLKQGPMQSRDIVLIFMHIPKAAGSTLEKIIGRQYPKQSIQVAGWSMEPFKAAIQ